MTIDLDYLYLHKKDILCVVAISSKKVQEEIKEQMLKNGFDKIYTIDSADIFNICDEISEGKQDEFRLPIQNFLKERKYEFQIETTSFCNAKCVFCSNPTLKRKKAL